MSDEAATPDSGIPKEERTFAMLCHLLGLVTNFVGPLVVWLIKKDTMPFVNEQGKEALNFYITVVIALIVSSFLIPVFFIGCALFAAVMIGAVVLTIMAAVKVNAGVHYRYPFALRLIK